MLSGLAMLADKLNGYFCDNFRDTDSNIDSNTGSVR